jgi:glycosyltransferase involved in cell wall biosynthesis
MKIIVNATCLNANYCTGIERYAYHLCQELCHIDSSITCFSSTPISGVAVTKIPVVLKVSRLIFGSYEYYVRAIWDQTLFRYRVFRNKPDVVFFPIQDGMFFPPVKQIITVHDLHYFHFNSSIVECKQEFSAHRRLFYRLKMAHVLRNSFAILAVSEATKQDIIGTFGVSPDKIHVVYNGYVPSLFHDMINPLPVLERLGIAGYKYFLFVGSILRHKNIVRLVQAFAFMNPEIILIIAGACKDPDYLEEVMNASAGLGEGRVRYLKYVTDDDLPSLYSGAEALIFPSLHEGFGVPIIEAMACGTPVITSNCSAMPEVAGDAAILIDPYSVESIVAAMREIVDNPGYASSLRSAGIEKAKMFRWSYSAQKLYDLCKMVSQA